MSGGLHPPERRDLAPAGGRSVETEGRARPQRGLEALEGVRGRRRRRRPRRRPAEPRCAAARTPSCSSRSSASRAPMSPRADHGSSSGRATVSAASSCSAASRRRPASTSWRARRASSSQASTASRPPRSAPRRSCGRSAASRRVRATGVAELERLDPAPVGHLVALAVADAHDYGLLAAQLAHVRVGGGGAVHVQHAVERRDRRLRLVLARGAQPALGGLLVVEGLGGDERHAPGDDGLGLRRGEPAPAAAQPPALRRAERGDHHDVLELGGVSAYDVAAVGRAQGPGILELDEAEQR